MNPRWVKADAWYRRDVNPYLFLTVSRNPRFRWKWRCTSRDGVLMCAGPVYGPGFKSYLEAMIEADAYRPVREQVAA